MSIRSSFERVKERNKRFVNKSYQGLNIVYEVLNANEFLKNPKSAEVKERIFQREYKVDKVESIFRLSNKSKSKVINIYELRSFFFDMGFNTDVSFSETFKSDMIMVCNVGGNLVPFWNKIVTKVFKKNKAYKKLFISALAPGKSRLHCRCYHGSDGAWYITAHIDNANWFNILNIFGIFKSHAVKGTGDYELGSRVFQESLNIALTRFREKKDVYVDIQEIYTSMKEGNLSLKMF